MAKEKLTARNATTTADSDSYIHVVKSGVSYKIKKSDFQKELSSGYRGKLAIADTPTQDGYYMATETGTYTNAGSLVTDLSLGVNYINVSGTQTVFGLSVVTQSIVPIGVIEKDNEEAVSGDTVYNSLVKQDFINLNYNNKWIYPLVNETYTSVQPNTFINVSETQLDTAPTLTTTHPFNYTGNALYLDVKATASVTGCKVVIPNSDIVNGDSFKVAVEVNCSNGGNLGLSCRNSATTVVSSTNSFAISAGVTKFIVLECVAVTDSPFYYLEFNIGFAPVQGSDFYYGRIAVNKGEYVNINGANTELIAEFKKLGYISDGEEIVARNLLDINEHEVEMSYSDLSLVMPNPDLNIFYSQFNPTYDAGNINVLIDHVDSTFDYTGNMMRWKLPNQVNGLFYILTTINLLNESVDGTKLYFNIEVKADSDVSVYVRAFEYSATWIGTNYGTTTIGSDTRVLSFEIDKTLISTDDARFGLRFNVSANAFGNNIYFGRMVLSDVATTSVSIKPTVQTSRASKPKKFIELGDSKVQQMQSLPKFCIQTGNYFSAQEIYSGKNGYEPTGVGGTKIIPTDGDTDSIYMRAGDVYRYSPEVCIIYGGANDPINNFITDGTWELILGNVEDDIYTGDGTELDSAGYRSYWQWALINGRDGSNAYDVSLASCYKGIIKKLQDNQADLTIMTKTVLIQSGGTNYQENVWIPLNNLIKEISNYYGLKCIDIAGESSINSFNAADYFDAPLVHENSAGGDKIAEVIIRNINY